MRRLSTELEAWLEDFNCKMDDLLAKGFKPTPENTRKGVADLTRNLVTGSPEIAWVKDDCIHAPHGDIPVRIYNPAPEDSLPVLVYYHGGGHMAGSVEVYDPICRKIARAAHHIVVSTDYRLAPEHPYPKGVQDAFAAAEHVWQALDRHTFNYQQRLRIGGDSGGGALCATVAHRFQKNQAVQIERQILIYPSLDYTLSFPSIEINSTGYLLEKTKIQWYFDHYFQSNEDRRKVSPLFMEASARLPRTMVVTAEFCPLRDEGAAYAKRLNALGVHAERLHFDDMIHAFLNMELVAKEPCDAVYKAIGRFLEE